MLFLIFTMLLSLKAYTECSNHIVLDSFLTFKELDDLERDLVENNDGLHIEQDILFRYLLYTLSSSSDVNNISSKDIVLIKPYNLRGDLMAVDIIDQVTEILKSKKFEHYKSKLDFILDEDPVGNFVSWYLMLKKMAKDDLRLMRKLNKNLVFQVYNKTGTALATTPKRSSKNYASHVKRNRLISIYNIYGTDPESEQLLLSFIPQKIEPYITNRLTVQKMKHVNKGELKEKRIVFYEEFCEEYLNMVNAVTSKYEIKCNPNNQNPITLNVSRDASKSVRYKLKPLFELVNSSRNKRDYTEILLTFGVGAEELRYPDPQSMLDNLGEYSGAIMTYSSDELILNQDVDEDISYSIKEFIPGDEFFGNSEQLSLKLAIRNDALATIVNKVRHGVKFYNDHGETHGTEIEVAKKLPNSNVNLTLIYHTNLFTNAHYIKIDENNYTNQTFTSEQVVKVLFNNISPEGKWYIDSGVGFIELNSTDDESLLTASGQQRFYHKNTHNYDIYNEPTPEQNQFGVNANFYSGMKTSFISSNLGLRLDVRGDLGIDVATIENYNNFKIRFASDLYYQRPNGAVGARLFFGLPLTFHRTIDSEENSSPSLEVRPKVGFSIGSRKTEFGLALEVPFGELRTYIEENSRTVDDGIILDYGEIGTIYLKKKF